MLYEIPAKVVKALKDADIKIRNNLHVCKVKVGKFEWELFKDIDGDVVLVKWDKDGFGFDYEIPDDLKEKCKQL